jgi:hypothetical protein
VKRTNFDLSPSEKFPKLLDAQLGVEEGFIDAAELIDASVPDEIKAAIRIRLGIAPKLDGFPYFSGYAIGHELFTLCLGVYC